MYKFFLKRVIDFCAALTGLFILSPVFFLLALLLAFANNGRIFFIQRRPGLHGKVFKVIKFKTMNDRRGEDGELLPDIQRITKIGHVVRMLSLDELPQLINVIKGDMALVGPRPLLEKYMSLYNEFQMRRHEVRPGITGWAQVNGRNSISWEQKFNLDVYYVDNVSFTLDLKILLLTVRKAFARTGINSSNDAPMETFTGNRN